MATVTKRAVEVYTIGELTVGELCTLRDALKYRIELLNLYPTGDSYRLLGIINEALAR